MINTQVSRLSGSRCLPRVAQSVAPERNSRRRRRGVGRAAPRRFLVTRASRETSRARGASRRVSSMTRRRARARSRAAPVTILGGLINSTRLFIRSAVARAVRARARFVVADFDRCVVGCVFFSFFGRGRLKK